MRANTTYQAVTTGGRLPVIAPIRKWFRNGSGVEGEGLQAYADSIGRTAAYVTQVRNAAEVIRTCNVLTQVNKFSEKAKHLDEIHKLTADLWKPFVKLLLRFNWSKDRTGEGVREGSAIVHYPIPDGGGAKRRDAWQARTLRPIKAQVIRARGTGVGNRLVQSCRNLSLTGARPLSPPPGTAGDKHRRL